MSWSRTDEENWLYVLQARWDETGGSAVVPVTREVLLGPNPPSKVSGYTEDHRYPIYNMKWFYESQSLGMSSALRFSLYTYAAITGLPDIDTNGFLQTGTSGYFRMSWVQNMFSQLPSVWSVGEIWANSWSNSANGSWDDFTSFWLNSYPSTSFFSIVATAKNIAQTDFGAYAGGTGEIIEVLESKAVRPLMIEFEGLLIPGPGVIAPHAGSVPPGTYDSSVTDKQDWPWVAAVTWPSEYLEDWDFRSGHLIINSGIHEFPQIREDLTNRYKTVERVDAQAEEYVNNKYQLFDQLLQATTEVPKEFRVRCQTSPTFDMSKLSSMAMPTDTGTTTATGPLETTGGSSY